jgi:hypothetical protein
MIHLLLHVYEHYFGYTRFSDAAPPPGVLVEVIQAHPSLDTSTHAFFDAADDSWEFVDPFFDDPVDDADLWRRLRTCGSNENM